MSKLCAARVNESNQEIKNNTRTQLLDTDLTPQRKMVEDDISLKKLLRQDQFDISHTTKKFPISIFEKKKLSQGCPKGRTGFLLCFGKVLPHVTRHWLIEQRATVCLPNLARLKVQLILSLKLETTQQQHFCAVEIRVICTSNGYGTKHA